MPGVFFFSSNKREKKKKERERERKGREGGKKSVLFSGLVLIAPVCCVSWAWWTARFIKTDWQTLDISGVPKRRIAVLIVSLDDISHQSSSLFISRCKAQGTKVALEHKKGNGDNSPVIWRRSRRRLCGEHSNVSGTCTMKYSTRCRKVRLWDYEVETIRSFTLSCFQLHTS